MAQTLVDVDIHLQKSTGGTHVYGERTEGNPPKIKSLYLPRWMFPDGDSPPETLRITVAMP